MKETEISGITVKKRHRNYRVTIHHAEKINFLNSEEIKMKLFEIIKNPRSHLLLNLSNIRFVDSAGMAVFEMISKVSVIYGSRFTLVKVNNEIIELLELAKQHNGYSINYLETGQYLF
ncbi:MAG: STAS domain-containing protein [Bacteroidales bacterium]|nr:STAS domain-containing protein [Bacteroidales bacterium]